MGQEGDGEGARAEKSRQQQVGSRQVGRQVGSTSSVGRYPVQVGTRYQLLRWQVSSDVPLVYLHPTLTYSTQVSKQVYGTYMVYSAERSSVAVAGKQVSLCCWSSIVQELLPYPLSLHLTSVAMIPSPPWSADAMVFRCFQTHSKVSTSSLKPQKRSSESSWRDHDRLLRHVE